ncbi:carboxylate-amine ligase [cf. Phormidesmis sp. LEGE 11477]|uniref:carboxylate-amine ligase n=1 Tax=cf. Phormidesmis sp. LEGE 11477 TaxID=1828680 RepID=UPI001882C16A|nr:carboxylate-amine ligase [cf. Phormidesmis sp. LEGE 11477]MBE9060249.1 carboxylate-amine ligase [cf. Phormidesmis sp. LEGE 11477]
MVPDFTIGVEEEYQIVDPKTRSLTARSKSLIKTNKAADVEQEIVHELFRCEVEIATDICHTLDDVRQALVQARTAVIEAAKENGAAIAAAGTHPFSPWEDQEVTPKDRYYALQADLRQIIRELIILGCHVHVGVEDREMAVQISNRSRNWLPLLLALTANSPFSEGKDTGYDSYRMALWCRLPTAGPPPLFQDYANYQSFIQQLIDTGITDDPTKVYWDIRLSERFPTVEFRMSDVCASIEEAVMLAGIIRALAYTCYQDAINDQPAIPVRAEMLKAAMWQAARYGLNSELIDFATMKPVPAKTLVQSFMSYIQPGLAHFGDEAVVQKEVDKILSEGNSAQRQRAIYEKTDSLESVVDDIVRRSALQTNAKLQLEEV